MIFGDQRSLNLASFSAKLIAVYVTGSSVVPSSSGVYLDLEHRQRAIRIALDRSGDRSSALCAHPRVEAGRVRIGLDHQHARLDGPDLVERVSEQATADAAPVRAGIDPE